MNTTNASTKKLLELQKSSEYSEKKQNNSNSSAEEAVEVKTKIIKETPFMLINKSDEPEKGWVITTANMALKDGFETSEEAEKYIKKKPWDLIAVTAIAMAKYVQGN